MYLRDVNALRIGSADVDAVCEVLGVGSIEVVATVVLAADDLEVAGRSREDKTITVDGAVASGRSGSLRGPNVGSVLVQGRHATFQVACTCPGHSLALRVGIAQLQAPLEGAGPFNVTKVATVVVGSTDNFELLLRGSSVEELVEGVLVRTSWASGGGLARQDSCAHQRACSQSRGDEDSLERHV
jgi:hypothetical protein